MTAPGLSPAEQATVDRFDAAEPAPESWRANRAARNATCCDHAASDHDTHGCAVNLSNHSRTYERCHGLVTARPVGDGDGQDELRGLLLHHHPIMRSEDGPFSGCRCGSVRLGQDVIQHVMTELEPWAERVARERAAEELEEVLSRGTSQSPLEAFAWAARRHVALRAEVRTA